MSRAVAWLVLLLGLVGLGYACAGCRLDKVDTANLVRRQAAKALQVVTDGLGKYDVEEQEKIVKSTPDGKREEALTKYFEGTQRPMFTALDVFRGALDQLSAGLAAYKAGAKQDWSALVSAVLKAALDLAATLKRLGVPVDVPKISRLEPERQRDACVLARGECGPRRRPPRRLLRTEVC